MTSGRKTWQGGPGASARPAARGRITRVSSIASGLVDLHGWVAYLVIAALVFGETAVFVGFVLPGEIATILGGVLASRGHVSLAVLILVVVIAAIAGPFVGYEIGRRTGDRLFAAKGLARVRGGVERTRSVLSKRGGAAVFLGRFIAVARAIMPDAAGAGGVRLATFAVYNVLGGLLWGVGYCLLGYLAGSAYAVVEERVGAGLAIAIGAVVVIAAAIWAIRRHRAQSAPADAQSAAADAQSKSAD
jgi:membrane-associated protein